MSFDEKKVTLLAAMQGEAKNVFQAFERKTKHFSDSQDISEWSQELLWGFRLCQMSALLEASFFTLKELETLGKSKGVIPQAPWQSARLKINSKTFSKIDLRLQQSSATQMALSQSDCLKWISNSQYSGVVVLTVKDWTYEAVKDVVESLVADDEVQSDKATWIYFASILRLQESVCTGLFITGKHEMHQSAFC